MNIYDAEHIRNVALVGHQGSGKTMLAEAMLLNSGAIQRMGSITDGTTVSDYHPSEVERQMSVFASLVHVEQGGYKINLLDTPGYPDFVGEVITSLKVADTAVFIINAAEGIQVGTELAWSTANKAEIPCMFVLNHLDRGDANFRDLVTQIQEQFGRGATVVQIPGGSGSRAIIDVLLMKQLTFPAGEGKPQVSDIAPEFQEEAEQLHNELIENIAENDESLMELYFEKGTLSEDEMRKGLHEAMIKRQLFPIFLTSATENIGVNRLVTFMSNVCPSPLEMPPAALEEGEPVTADANGSPVAFIYRTMAEQHVGEYSFFKVYSGTLEQGMDLENAQTGSTERLGQLFGINGHEREPVSKMFAGDIGALVKAEKYPLQQHASEKRQEHGYPEYRIPRAEVYDGGPAGQAGRRRQAGAGYSCARQRRSLTHFHSGSPPQPDASGGAGGDAPHHRPVPAAKPVRGRGRVSSSENLLP